MSPTTVTSPPKMKSLRRWNSILGLEHRRSQSLNGLKKSPSAEAMRSSTSLGTFRIRDDEQASILTASSSTEVIAEEEDDEAVSPISTNSRNSYNTSPPPRPKPAPRLWSDAVPATSSLRGLETAIAPNRALPAVPNQTAQIPPASTLPSSPNSPRALVSKFSSWKQTSFAGRRKGSVPELELGTDKIRTFSPDSPTLPPILSARTPSTYTQGSLTPRPVVSDSALSESYDYTALKTPEWKERDNRRASSMLLPYGLAPIVIPSAPSRIPPVPPIDTSIATLTRAKSDEKPPRPPPKSPRTLLRAFPIPKSSTLPGGHTANSSISSVSSADTPSTAATVWSPVSLHSAAAIVLPESSKQNTSPAKQSSRPSSPPSSHTRTSSLANNPQVTSNMKHGRSVSNSQTEPKLTNKSSSPALASHARITSEASVINRGRPMKRAETPFTRGPVRTTQMAIINGSFEDLPLGIRKSQTGYIPADELNGLRRDAEDLASNYNILTQRQIAGLNQEQRLLDDSCEELQHTISDLKDVRKTCYHSLKLFLESPSANTIRDQVLKQTMALCEIDAQIDEMQAKLDIATDRKLSIQSKVWEHLAAILTAVSLAAEVGLTPDEHTPPRSPDRQIRRSITDDPIVEDGIMPDFEPVTREGVESITIYADSGVASLLRSIEEELDVLDQSRYQGEEMMMV